MFITYLILLIVGVLMEVDFFAMVGYLPFAPLHITQTNNMVLGVAIQVADKWFFPLGIIAIIFGIVGMVKGSKSDDKTDKFMVTMLALYLIILVLGVL